MSQYQQRPTPEMPDLYGSCQAQHETTDTDVLLQCIADKLSEDVGSRAFTRITLLVFAGALVFLMQAGFAMLCAGAVRKKNVQNTMLKNLLDACGASVAFFTVGYAFAFGGMDPDSPKKTFMGTQNFFLIGVDNFSFWFFQYAFAAAAGTIVAGTLAERCQMAAYLCYSVMLAGWVYPIIAHHVWSSNGFFSAFNVDPLWGVGMIDFAGSGVVHVTGGVTALFATMILGPRRGRFHDDAGRRLDRPRDFHGHSVALQMLGTFLLWFGWYGFNSGSALLATSHEADRVAPLAAVNSTLAGGIAGIVALFGNLWYLERYTGEPFFDLKYAMNGSLCGLVGITAGCGVFEPWAAFLTGAVAGLLYIVGSRGLVYIRLDDAVDAIPVHFLNGMWGIISVGLFASPERLQAAYNRSDHPGLVYTNFEDARLLGVQVLGLFCIIAWVLVIMLPFFIWLDWRGWFRSDPLEEIVGLDQSYHGGLALLSGEEAVQPEYITALRKKKEEQRNSIHQRRRFNSTPATSSSAGMGGAQSDTMMGGADSPPEGVVDQDDYFHHHHEGYADDGGDVGRTYDDRENGIMQEHGETGLPQEQQDHQGKMHQQQYPQQPYHHQQYHQQYQQQQYQHPQYHRDDDYYDRHRRQHPDDVVGDDRAGAGAGVQSYPHNLQPPQLQQHHFDGDPDDIQDDPSEFDPEDPYSRHH